MALACGDGPRHVLLVIYPYTVTTVLHGIRKEREKNWSGVDGKRTKLVAARTVACSAQSRLRKSRLRNTCKATN